MVELKEFVTSVLCQIIDGVADAQTKSPGPHYSESLVAPTLNQMHDRMGDAASDMAGAAGPRMVEFDVAVSTSERSEAKGGVGVFVGGLGAGMKGGTQSEQSHVSRIRFEIPICLPTDTTELNRQLVQNEQLEQAKGTL